MCLKQFTQSRVLAGVLTKSRVRLWMAETSKDLQCSTIYEIAQLPQTDAFGKHDKNESLEKSWQRQNASLLGTIQAELWPRDSAHVQGVQTILKEPRGQPASEGSCLLVKG